MACKAAKTKCCLDGFPWDPQSGRKCDRCAPAKPKRGRRGAPKPTTTSAPKPAATGAALPPEAGCVNYRAKIPALATCDGLECTCFPHGLEPE